MFENPFYVGLLFGFLFLFPTTMFVGYHLCKFVASKVFSNIAIENVKFANLLISFVLASVVLLQFETFLWKANEARDKELKASQTDDTEIYAQKMWARFLTLEERLYKAKDDNDPAVQELLKVWEFPVRIGPYHRNGKRELAFENSQVIPYCPPAVQARWFVGLDYPRRHNNEQVELFVEENGQTQIATESSYVVAATRAGDLVNVDVYCDNPISTEQGAFKLETTVLRSIGADAFDRFAGNIAMHKRSEQPTNRVLDCNMRVAFLSALTPAERADLKAIVTSRPCVTQIFTLNKVDRSMKFKKSPYIKFRLADTSNYLLRLSN